MRRGALPASIRPGKAGPSSTRRSLTFPDGRQLVERTYSPPDWRADAFHLERSYQDRWGRRVQADLTLLIRQAAEEVAREIGVDVELLLAESAGVPPRT